MKVELIFDVDCPNVPPARELLLSAFSEVNLKPAWTELDRAEGPAHAQVYGSPTILVNGKDVSANQTNGQNCCRLYLHDDGYRGVPPQTVLVDALRAANRRKFAWSRLIACLPSLSALLPILQCPACWPAYSAVATSLGLGFLLKSTFAAPIICSFLPLALVSLGYRARSRHGYGPLTLGSIAATSVLLGKFFFSSDFAVYGGIVALLLASIWNSLPVAFSKQAKAQGNTR